MSLAFSRSQLSHIALWAGIPITLAIVNCYQQRANLTSPQLDNVLLSTVFGCIIVVVLVFCFLPEHIDGDSLYKIIPKLVDLLDLPMGEEMRVTFWVPARGDQLKQATRYWPNNVKGTTKLIENAKGLVGRVYRMSEADIYQLDAGKTSKDYQKDLVSHFGYSLESAKRVNQEQRSFMAIPISRGKDVVGVFYCDSSSYGLFPESKYNKDWIAQATKLLSLVEPLL